MFRMANACSDSTCHFLRLPRELRDQIYGEVFFPGEEQPEDFEQDRWGLAPTAVRQIHPYDTDLGQRPRFDVAIIRTSRQIQEEAEAVFYGTSSFNLMYQDWCDSVKLSYELLEKFPARNRRLIRRIERKCYSEPYAATISLCDWKLFMAFLARECPNLQSLKLWGPGDRHEGPLWVQTCRQEAEWVQAILQIRGLSYFDIPVIKFGVIYDYPPFRDDFLPWLKTSLLQDSPRHLDRPPDPQVRSVSGFPFLQLPSNVRKRVYELVLLPPSRRLHPYLAPWYDQTTHNLVPLVQTCRLVRDEAEKTLYGTAVFTSQNRKYDLDLLEFFYILPARLRGFVRSVRLEDGDGPSRFLIRYLLDDMQVEELTLVVSPRKVDHLNADWQHRGGDQPCTGWYKRFLRLFARFNKVRFETPDPSSELDPSCRAWLETGLRAELEDPSSAKDAWLVDDSEDYDETSVDNSDDNTSGDRSELAFDERDFDERDFDELSN